VVPKRYVVQASAGQELTVDLNADNANAYLTVLAPDGNNLAGAGGPIKRWSGRLPATGDYVIEVLNAGTGLANFVLMVAIVAPPASGPINDMGVASVDAVDVRILESFPVQVQVAFRGTLANPCVFIRNLRQIREGNTFRIGIETSTYPDRICTQVLAPFEQVLALEVTGLPAGTYEVRVGNVVTPFQLP
jgi:hypothetical protein